MYILVRIVHVLFENIFNKTDHKTAFLYVYFRNPLQRNVAAVLSSITTAQSVSTKAYTEHGILPERSRHLHFL